MKIGDKVRVIECKQYKQKHVGETGEVVRIYNHQLGVLLDGQPNKASHYGCYWFKYGQVEILSKAFMESEDDIIMLNTSEFRVAKVKFMGGGHDQPCSQTYALYDSEAGQGDMVVVKTGHHGFMVAEIEEIFEHSIAPKYGREIICKVDMDAYNARKERRAKLIALQAEMDKRVKELQTMAVYEILSEKDGTMRALFEEFKQLTEKKAGEKGA